MNTFSLELTTVYAHLTSFAGLESFWANFNTAFGSEYDLAKAENLRLQWQNQDFSQLPTIRVLDSDLDGILGAESFTFVMLDWCLISRNIPNGLGFENI